MGGRGRTRIAWIGRFSVATTVHVKDLRKNASETLRFATLLNHRAIGLSLVGGGASWLERFTAAFDEGPGIDVHCCGVRIGIG
jgi:hypothetical protein